MFNVFALLILAGAALAAFNLATRIVEAQRREIGIGMALGVPPRQLAIRPLMLGVQVAVAGTLLGLALGLLMGQIFRGVLEDLLPLPEMRTPFEAGVFLRAARSAWSCRSSPRRSRSGAACGRRRSRRSGSASARPAAAASPAPPSTCACPVRASASYRCATLCGPRAERCSRCSGSEPCSASWSRSWA
jgi:hypothetical protein